MKHMQFILIAMLFTLLAGAGHARSQGSAFAYQGRLSANPNGSGASGIFDLRFTIYDALTNGNVVAGPLINAPTAVSNGLLTVTLDFGGGAFDGSARWLEIGVRTDLQSAR